jgi:hypothetical protein
VLADFIDRDDVLVCAASRRTRLDEEPLHEVRVVAKQELHRDLAAELRVATEEHLPHAATGDLADQLEPADRAVPREVECGSGVAALACRRIDVGDLDRILGQRRGDITKLPADRLGSVGHGSRW